MKIHKCVKCGYCCKVRPCLYGELNKKTGYCKYLTVSEETEFYTTYVCSRYDEIIQEPDYHISPAFGEGCSSPLFNTDRNNVLKGKIKMEKQKKFIVITGADRFRIVSAENHNEAINKFLNNLNESVYEEDGKPEIIMIQDEHLICFELSNEKLFRTRSEYSFVEIK